ncbi:regulator of G protein signaling domain protein, partial [Opisthorchis viverrini]
DDPPQSEDLPSSELQPDLQKPTKTPLFLEQVNIPRRQTEHFKSSSTTGDYQVSSRVCEKESVAALPDFLPYSQRTQGSMKRSKIGIPFFRQKPTPSAQYKAVQMKELKRMIRAVGLALFKDFLSTEFSDENIEFWIACQEYKKITNPKKLAARAQQIFDQFVAVQAVREPEHVNLDSKTRLETEAEIANPTVHTLDNAQKRIQALMEKDSYRRFLRSEVYLTLYSEAREVAKAVAASALAASLQEASEELEGAVLNLITSSSSTSHFSFLSNLGSNFNASTGTGLHLPGVAAAAASAEAGMNSVQDLQLLGLSTSRHMRNSRKSSATDTSAKRPPKTESDSHSGHSNASTSDQAR